MRSPVLPPHFGARCQVPVLSMAAPRSLAKAWVFTAHSDSESRHVDLDWPWADQIYGIYQHEICPTTGRFHIQGYCVFAKRVRLSHVKRLHSTAHWEVARGNPTSNRVYCSKLDTRVVDTLPVEYGDITAVGSQGKASEYHEAMELIKLQPTATEEDFAAVAPSVWLRLPNAYTRARQLYHGSNVRLGGIRVIVYIGPAGCGKSDDVLRRYPGAYWKAPGKWWDKYDRQECVVFDDFDGSWFSCSELLRILDRYPVLVETKGAHTDLDATGTYIITSNVFPEEWYRKHCEAFPAHKKAILRRLTTIISYIGDPSFEKPVWRIQSGKAYMAPPATVPVTGYEPFLLPDDTSQYVADLSTINF